MSRIPPASVRLTSDLLNYNQVGASGYYFYAHLKETILHEKIVNMLGNNVGFVTMKQKKKHLPRIIMGVLPIYSILRAKTFYDRFFTKSYDWLRTKLFRGAQSSAVRYHNGVLFSRTRHAMVAERDDVVVHQKPNAEHTQRPTTFASPTDTKERVTSQFLQNLASYRWKPNQNDYINHFDWYTRFNLKSIPQKSRLSKPLNITQELKIRRSDRTNLQLSQEKRLKSAKSPNVIDIYDAKLKALLSPVKKTKQIMSTLCKYDNKVYRPYRKGDHRYKKSQNRVNSTGCYRRAWSKKSLFALFCFEQIIGKINSYPNNCLTLGRKTKNRESIRKKTLHAQGLQYKSTTTKGNASMLKKRYKKFYDIQFIGMLNSDSRLEIRNGRNIPRSQIERLKPRTLYELLPGSYKKEVAKKKFIHRNKGWSTRRVNNDNDFLKAHRAGVPFKPEESDKVRLLDFDRYIGQFKTNVTPKFWVSRRFNANMIVNLFFFVQGKITGKHKRLSAFQGGCSATVGSGNGVPRLKSGFLFEFDVHSKSSEVIKSLRPTISLRF